MPTCLLVSQYGIGAEPVGKVADFAPRGYFGLQNHDWETSVWFRNIRVKKLD
jgi:hypothetical protein